MKIKNLLNLKILFAVPFLLTVAFCCSFMLTQKNVFAQSDTKDNIRVEYLTKETVYNIGEKYTEEYIDIYEDNQKMDYKMEESGNNSTYYVKYYIGTLNDDGTPKLSTPTPALSTASQKDYIVNYVVTSSTGKKYQFYRQIIVSNDVIKPTNVDSKIYAKLLEISNEKTYVHISDFEKNSYIDLSGIYPNSLAGIELLKTSGNVVIDLSNNNLNNSNIQEINNILSANSYAKLVLQQNNFDLSQIGEINDLSRCIFGIQNLKTKIISSNDDVCIGDIFSDFTQNFDISMQGLTVVNNKLMLNKKGQDQLCVVTSKVALTNNKEYETRISFGYINLAQKTLTKEYSENVIIYADEFFTMEGLSASEQKIVEDKYNNKNIRALFSQLNNLGEFDINFTFDFDSTPISLKLKFINQDTTAPEIDFKGKKEVYITSKAQYNELYKNDECKIIDGHDGELTPSVTELNLNDFGTYNVEYSAKDSSNNVCTFVRIVHYGKVELTNNSSEEQYNSRFIAPILFYEFEENDFTATYKIDNTTSSYDQGTGILLKAFGSYDIKFELTHKKNENIKYLFTNHVNVVDYEPPKITLKGEADYELYAGSKYAEQGYVVTDNSTDDVLSETKSSKNISFETKLYFKSSSSNSYVSVNKVDTKQVGTYKITYIAKDKFGNREEKTRFIEIVYAPIENLSIDETKLLTQYSQGKVVEFDLISESEYITSPNPLMTWFVNGNVVGTSKGKLKYQFHDAGDYEVYGVLSDNPKVVTQVVTLHIYEKSPYENTALWLGIGFGAIAIVGFCAFLIGLYKKRNFY